MGVAWGGGQVPHPLLHNRRRGGGGVNFCVPLKNINLKFVPNSILPRKEAIVVSSPGRGGGGGPPPPPPAPPPPPICQPALDAPGLTLFAYP